MIKKKRWVAEMDYLDRSMAKLERGMAILKKMDGKVREMDDSSERCGSFVRKICG